MAVDDDRDVGDVFADLGDIGDLDFLVGIGGIGGTIYSLKYFEEDLAMNWWKSLLASAGVVVAGTLTVDTFMSSDYAYMFLWGAGITLVVGVVRRLIRNT